MTNLFTISTLLLVGSSLVDSIPFDRHHHTRSLFGVRGGGSHQKDNQCDASTSFPSGTFCNPFHDAYDDWAVTHTADHDNADYVILNAVDTAEKAFVHAVEDEVDSLFHRGDDTAPTKATILAKNNKNNPVMNTRRGGGASKPTVVEHEEGEDRARVVKAITDAVDNVEHKIQHAIEEEVNNFFHEIGHHEDDDHANVATKKENIVAKAKQSVSKSAKKVKSAVANHPAEEGLYDIPFMRTHYPYDWPHGNAHVDAQVLHAVEAAEKAVLHAVEDEVHSLFHDLKEERNEHDTHDKKTRKGVTESAKRGVKKVKKVVDEKRKDRRNWLSTEMDRRFDAYEYFLENGGMME